MPNPTIKFALKNTEGDIRITYGNCWLVWNNIDSEWSVYEHKPYQKNSRLVISTPYEKEAVMYLLAR